MVDYTYVLFKCPVCNNVLKTSKMHTDIQGICPFCENAIIVPEDENNFVKTKIIRENNQ